MTVKFEDDGLIVNDAKVSSDKTIISCMNDFVYIGVESKTFDNRHTYADARTLGQALIFMADNGRVPDENELQLSEIAQMGTTASLIALTKYVKRLHDAIDNIPDHIKKSFYLEKLMAVRSEEE